MRTEEQEAKEEDETKHPLEHVIERLGERGYEPAPSGDGYVAFCPAHEDRNRPNLSINNGRDGRVVMYCPACGADGKKVALLLGLEVRDLFPPELRTSDGASILTLAELADSKGLDAEFLNEIGLTESDQGIEIPYFDIDGALLVKRIRIRRNGRDQVRQPKGERLRAYGLDRLGDGRIPGLFLVEGESDCWTLWSEGFPAVGLPGATAVSALDDLPLERIDKINVVLENDHGGTIFAEKVFKELKQRGYQGELCVVPIPQHLNDVNDLFREDPDGFMDAFWAQVREGKEEGSTPEPQREKPLRVKTAADLYREGRQRPDWIVEGLVARGVLTSFVAAYKAGKTTLLMGLVKVMATGGEFLGLKTKPAKVLYLTEENNDSFKSVLRRVGLQNSREISVIRWSEVAGLKWPELMSRAASYAKKIDAQVLVIDTLHRFAGLEGEDENHAGAVLAATKPVQRAKARDLAIVAVLHAGKGERSSGNLSRGSSAFGGEADVILEMRRVSQSPSDSRRRLTGTLSRFEETPANLLADYSGGEYQLVSRDESAGNTELRERITTHLEGRDGSATVPEIIREIGSGEKGLRKAIRDLESEGSVISKVQSEKRGKPILVTLVGELAAEMGPMNQPPTLPQAETSDLLQ